MKANVRSSNVGASAKSLAKTGTWKALKTHFKEIQGSHLRDLFAGDPHRGETMTAEALGIFFDYSKNRATSETLRLLVQLAEEMDLRGRIDAMFRGDKI